MSVPKIIKTWLISLITISVLLFLYIFILGRGRGDVSFPEVLYNIVFIYMVISFLISIFGISYSLIKDTHNIIWTSMGMFFISGLLFAQLFVTSIIYFWVMD